MPDEPYYVDADGHLVEHPTGIQEYAPAGMRDRVWHVESDSDGVEWVVMGDAREPANVYAAAAERRGLVQTIMAAAPRNKTRLRSAIEALAPNAALIWVVSAVSREVSSPARAPS